MGGGCFSDLYVDSGYSKSTIEHGVNYFIPYYKTLNGLWKHKMLVGGGKVNHQEVKTLSFSLPGQNKFWGKI